MFAMGFVTVTIMSGSVMNSGNARSNSRFLLLRFGMEINMSEENRKDDNTNSYEKICYICHRPESKVEKMITIPNNITICSDCMQKTFDQIGMQGMPTYPGMEILNLGAMGMEPPTEFQERHKVKTKKKEKRRHRFWTSTNYGTPCY